MCLVTGVWNEGEMSPGGREMTTSSGEREERRPGLMTVLTIYWYILNWNVIVISIIVFDPYTYSIF